MSPIFLASPWEHYHGDSHILCEHLLSTDYELGTVISGRYLMVTFFEGYSGIVIMPTLIESKTRCFMVFFGENFPGLSQHFPVW